MHINLESKDLHTIEAYSDNQIKINKELFEKNFALNAEKIIPDWQVKSIGELNETNLTPLLQFKPKIIIIGTNEKKLIPYALISKLTEFGVGIEVMNIGAACRTFNVLLSEGREVVLGIIF